MKKNKSLSIVVILSIIIIFGLLVYLGWSAWRTNNNVIKISDKTFSVIVDPNVGGGFIGEVNMYTITYKGEVFNTHSPSYQEEAIKSLIKNVTGQEILELRNSFIDSGVMDVDSGEGPQYAGSMLIVTINGKEKTFYNLSSQKFDNVKSKIKNITGQSL